jgi:rubrerythrin
MNDVETFLAHAIELEREAARRYEELAAAMRTEGNRELRSFFTEMAHFSRMHLSEARERGGFRELPVLAPGQYQWPDGVGPETADWVGVDALMDERAALELALRSERRGHAYYASVAATARDPELRAMAREFATEEAQHVVELERLIAARSAPA